jgi:hypothetical protein
MRTKIIAFEVMKDEILSVPGMCNMDISFITMRLHLNSGKLNVELQRQLDFLDGYTHIVLPFGLCGGAERTFKSKHSTPWWDFYNKYKKASSLSKLVTGIFSESGTWNLNHKKHGIN